MRKVVLFAVIISILSACSTGRKPTQPTPPVSVAPPAETEQQILARIPKPIGSFGTAKKKLYNKIYKGHQRTLYCDCKFTTTGKVYLGSCGVDSRKNERRAKQLEAEHVFPAYHMGQNRACWTQKLCTNSKGEPFKGRKCCEKQDKVFRVAHNDLHNLYPAVGEINGDRSNYKFGMIAGEKRAYGQCDFEVDKEAKRAEPPENVRGNIARTYFYMSKTYNMPISKQQRQMFEAWNKSDPVDDWERERNQRIEKLQGNKNPYIK
ncbi:MAG TPA: endonuclease I [Thiothrix sp.]|nr:endonuclease I [Thiothrix sp.]